MFDPKTGKYPYTEYTDGHYIVITKTRGYIFDEKYAYVDQSKKFRFRQTWARFLLNLFFFPVARIRFGLKIVGKKNFKKNKKILKQGVVSISNHINFWDYICVMKTIRPFRSYILARGENVNDKSGNLVRLVGGIPIPDKGIRAKATFIRSVDNLIKNGGWLHVFPEGSMWEYYAPIRPFKTGAANFAVRNNKPIMPLGFSYREPGWIRKHIFKQIACLNINIGNPIYPNHELSKIDQILDLTKRSHEAVCELVGFEDGKNIYPPIFENNKRIDY